MKYLILKGRTCGGAEDTVLSYAVIKMDRDTVESLMERLELAKTLKREKDSLQSIVFWNYDPVWLTSLDELEELFGMDLSGTLDDEGIDGLVEAPDVDFYHSHTCEELDARRTELDELHVFDDFVTWMCCEKNTDILVKATDLKADDIAKLAKHYGLEL